jgi:putative transposase
LPATDRVVGIDLGLTTFATLSDGSTIERQRWMAQDEKDLKRLQRQVSRLPQGSPQRRKAVHALQHAHQRIAQRRNNFAHQESRKLIDHYQFIAFEKLDIRGMQGNGLKTINRGIADVAWGQFVQFTVYKAEEAGRGTAHVPPGARLKIVPVVVRAFLRL